MNRFKIATKEIISIRMLFLESYANFKLQINYVTNNAPNLNAPKRKQKQMLELLLLRYERCAASIMQKSVNISRFTEKKKNAI